MNIAFPTFRRLLGIRFKPLPFQFRKASWAQRRSLLRLIAVGTENNVPLSQLIDAWANDESRGQRVRLHYLASLMRNGTPLPEAIEQVPRLLREDDILAIRFGSQSGTLAATIRDRLEQRDPVLDVSTARLRKSVVYLSVFVVVAFAVMTFWMTKIVPQLRQILSEFDIVPPAAFEWTEYLASYWYVFVVLFAGGLLLIFTPWPGRRLRLRIAGRLFRPVRQLRIANVLQTLSVTAQAGRPLAGALSTLARYHFDPALRHQLLVVRNEFEYGAGIWSSMQSLGLLSSPEARALTMSEQVGNQSWVLKQLAQVKRRSVAKRVLKWSTFVLPLIVIALGAFVLLQGLSLFQALSNLIYSLA